MAVGFISKGIRVVVNIPFACYRARQLYKANDKQQQRDAYMNWQVYIIRCSDDSLYTGISTDAERRFAEHAAGSGAKYFRGRSPRKLVYLEKDHDRSSASRREIQIKKLRADEKRSLLRSPENQLAAFLAARQPRA